ncbi:Uncharacterised protein [Zhongshania aliphaticivorans]|uniref:BON domain-containing protein n=1 Tax=Zhongshania aliphaticivorans TaxID=1470434 RepID=A0A5S9NWZ0_9GAMM|nr:BON domain-containing protein [Zhongshania aliphaticivorans]CAA0095318.1 Uncharacterised protein [Zhongshania aliphaticivorans]CAA0113135.1 Uncharacterised protein [Zhongshania aliphaticivorans]
MNIKKLTMISAIALLCSNLAVANAAFSNNTVNVQASPHFSSSSTDQELINTLISRLEADKKLSGHLEINSYNGNIFVSGTVDEVAMIYRVVELIKSNSEVKQVDARKLDT